MKSKHILWIVAAVLAVATLIDLIDGYIPKLISSASLTIAVIIFAFGQEKSDKKVYNWAAYFFILIAFAGFAYRLMRHFNLY
jgi:hypothetical protein